MQATVIRYCGLPVFVACLAVSLATADDTATDAGDAFFEQRIRPLLVEHCYACHSGRAKKQKGGLRLDLRSTVRSGGESGPAIVPGRPEQSLLISAVRHESLKMPPERKLSDRAIADLVRWIELGAPDPRDGTAAPSSDSVAVDGRAHWAFQPVAPPARPAVRATDWPRNALDYFVLARLEQAELQPVADADRYTWLRRVTFDLTGLAPTVAEIRAFQQDTSPRAWHAVVDRLLATPAYGQRWARHWLDLVGYADQIGTSNNVFAEHAWRYRDYVVAALNADKPYAQFVREQIAGDLLTPETPVERAAGITATGFLVLGDLEIVEADKAKLRVDIVDQQLTKVSRAFLGLTIGCARCHDHKFDPIPQRDYYAIAGVFHSSRSVFKTDRGVWSDVLARELPETAEQQRVSAEQTQRHQQRLTALKAERTEAERQKKQLAEENNGADEATEGKQIAARKKQIDQLASKVSQLDRKIVHAEFFVPGAPRVYGVEDIAKPADMQITIRGNPRALGETVPRGFLQVATTVPAAIPAGASGRAELAVWIASPENPLTARVAANRIWQKLFGRGLVRSVDNFGLRGEKPSHPGLLDHLAHRFTSSGWSQKRLLRMLTLSRSYRMSSAHSPSGHHADPENRLLWRMNRTRLDAESLRDALLLATDQLHRIGGGSAIPLEYLENVGNIDPANVNPPSFSLSKWRPEQPFLRTLYLPVIRSSSQPGPAELRNVFDFPNPSEFTGHRVTTAVPTQALFLMNSPVLKKHAAALATRLHAEAEDETQRLELLWLRVLGRPIRATEEQEARAFLAAVGDGAWRELSHALFASNEFLMRL